MKKGALRRLKRGQRVALKSLADLGDDAVDTSDVPEVLDWSGAKRGLFYRRLRQPVTIRSGTCGGSMQSAPRPKEG
jgi:hypothetical protein